MSFRPMLWQMHAFPVMFVKRTRSAKTATERSREFRQRHPTYHADRKRRERAARRAHTLAMLRAEAEPTLALPTPATPLMLPAPQPPEFDLLEQLAALKARQAELELLLARAT